MHATILHKQCHCNACTVLRPTNLHPARTRILDLSKVEFHIGRWQIAESRISDPQFQGLGMPGHTFGY
jgi:hypothetical protein